MVTMKSANVPRFSLPVFIATSLFGLVVAILVQWIFESARPTMTRVTVAYQTTHSGQDHNSLLVYVNRKGETITVDDVVSPAPKWIESPWEQLTANEVDIANFDRAFEIVRSAPSSAGKAAALHNILHVVRVSPRAQLPVYGGTTYVPADYAPTPVSAELPLANSENVAQSVPTVGSFKPQTGDLPSAEIPAEHRQWFDLTLDRLKTAEAIARTLEPLPVVYGAWLDIKYNYESLQQWNSAERAHETALQVAAAYENSQYWQDFRATWIWPAVKAILVALAVGLGGVILDYFKKAFQFYSARGLSSLVQDEDFRKHLGLVAKEVQSSLILPESDEDGSPVRGKMPVAKPR
jgi:hypothetical protein